MVVTDAAAIISSHKII